MATFTVTTLDDDTFDNGDLTTETGDGAGLSLREALALSEANAGADTIVFDASLAAGTLTLTNGPLTISDDVAIDGDMVGGAGPDVTIDGNGGQILTIHGSAAVNGVGFQNGYALAGGAIAVVGGGDLELSDAVFTGNYAGAGGALYLGTGAAATVANSIFILNFADVGGAIASNGDLTLVNSTLYVNIAAGYGGGIYNYSGGNLTVVNSNIAHNGAAYGGGIANLGTAVIHSSTLTGNYASDYGGAILNGSYCGCYEGDLTLVNSIVAVNEAGYQGGEIYSPNAVTYQGVNMVGIGADSDASDGVIQALSPTDLFVNVGSNGLGGYFPTYGGLLDSGAGALSRISIVEGGPAHNAGVNVLLPPDVFDLDGDADTTEPLPVDVVGNPRVAHGVTDIGAAEIEAILVAELEDVLLVDVNGNGFADPGDTVRYQVEITNPASAAPADETGVLFLISPDTNSDLIEGTVTTSQGGVTTGNGIGDSSVAVSLGTIADGGGATISFDVTVGTPPSNQLAVIGFVHSDGNAPIPSDDPDDPTSAEDLTVTGLTPIANDDAFVTTEATVIANGDLFANNGDGADLGAGFQIAQVNGSAANVGGQITLASGALLLVNADGAFSYDPNDAWNFLPGPISGASNTSAPDTFTYTLQGGDLATVTITVNGLDTDDTLEGTAGPDALLGGLLDDILLGTAGIDTLDGEAGRDTASYVNSTAGVTVDLGAATASGGFAAGDTLVGMENLVGSALGDSLTGDDGDNILEGHAGADQIFGGDAYDFASYAFSDAGVTVNLATGVNTGGHAEGDTLEGIENLLGSAFADSLTGDDNGNELAGGAGADVLDGGGGRDMASYAGALSGVAASLFTGGSKGDAAGDVFIGIEDFGGSRFADVLIGNTGANTIFGIGGDDIINASAGNDFLDGGAGDDNLTGSGGADEIEGGAGIDTSNYANSEAAVTVSLRTGAAAGGHADGDTLISIESLFGSAFEDTLSGDAGANTLSGFNGDDFLTGFGGADTLVGGNGADTASYTGSGFGITVSFLTGLGSGGHAQGDTLLSVENLLGSSFADTITGGVEANVIDGRHGDDFINASNGDDTLIGGEGDDTLMGSGGADAISGGDGADTVSYGNAGAGVTVNLAAQTASGGHATGDTLSSIENATGSTFGDTLTAAAGGGTLNGFAGGDVLNDGAGDDVLIGGLGADVIVSGAGDDILSGGGGLDQFVFTTASFGNDIVIGFEPIVGAQMETFDFSAAGLDQTDFTVTDYSNGCILTHVDGLGGVNTITLIGVFSVDLQAGNWI